MKKSFSLLATLLFCAIGALPGYADGLSPSVSLPFGGRTQISQGGGLFSFFQQDVNLQGVFLSGVTPVTGTQYIHPCPYKGYGMIIIAPRAELQHVSDGKVFSDVQVSWNSYKWEDVLPIDTVDSLYKGSDPKKKAAARVRQLTETDPVWQACRGGYIYFFDLSRHNTPGIHLFSARCDIPAGVIKQLATIPGVSQVLQLLGQSGEIQLSPGKKGHYQALTSQYVLFQHYNGDGSYLDFIDFQQKAVAWYQTGDPNGSAPGLFFGGIDPRDYLKQRGSRLSPPVSESQNPAPAPLVSPAKELEKPAAAYTVTYPKGDDPNYALVTNVAGGRLMVVCHDTRGKLCQRDVPAGYTLPLRLQSRAKFKVLYWFDDALRPEIKVFGSRDE